MDKKQFTDILDLEQRLNISLEEVTNLVTNL